jgi:prepilin peptidase CpaA
VISPTLFVAVPMLSLLGLATATDLRDRRIPNGLSLGGAAIAALLQMFASGPTGLGLAALGWSVCLLCFVPLYISGGTAAGDVKLLALVGAFLGPIDGFVACIFTLIAGAVLGLLCLAWRFMARGHGNELPSAASPAAQVDPAAASHALDKIPYAAAIALGATAAVLQPAWLAALMPVGVFQ